MQDEDEAKDLTQDIFLKLYVKLYSYKGKSKFSTWVYSFTYNHCVSYVIRSSKRKYEMRLTESFDIENYAEDKDESNYHLERNGKRINIALQGIPVNDRSILELKYKLNLSIKNIESVLGIGKSAVKMRIKRAKTRLASSYAMGV